MFKKLILGVAVLSLVACAPAVPLQRDQTASFAKGASLNDVAKTLGKATINLSHEFDAKGKHYLANHYDLQTGARQEMAMVCSPTCIAYPIYVPVTAPYVMVYEGGTQNLIAWGTVEELSRSPDETISAIMPDLKASYDAELAKKKK